MRADFNYVKKATALVLDATPRGEKWAADMIQADADNAVDPIVDMVLALQDQYLPMESKYGQALEMKKVFRRFRKLYRDEYGDYPNMVFAQFIKAFEHGLIGFRIVIWG